MKTGLLGSCPVCEGEFKVRNGALVHHGFTRPGDGQIHGDCFAVGYEPYERSTKGCEDYKSWCERALGDAEKFLAEIPTRTYWSEVSVSAVTNKLTSREYALGVTDRYTWERFVTNKTRDAEHRVSDLRREIDRMEKRIAAFVLTDLKVVTEEQVTAAVKAARDARAAERSVKNAEKDAKAAALKAKRDAKQAERVAFTKAFVAKVKAANGDQTTIKSLVEDFRSKKNERKYGYFYMHEVDKMLTEDEKATLMAAGLAETTHAEWLRYTF